MKASPSLVLRVLPAWHENLGKRQVKAPKVYVADAGLLHALLGIPRTDRPRRLRQFARNFEFFGAPVALFLVIDRRMGRGQWAHLGMFMQSIALAAVEAGLGTCMQEAWASLRRSLHAHFELPDEEMIYCAIALGRPDPDAPVNRLRSAREPVESFASFRGFP